MKSHRLLSLGLLLLTAAPLVGAEARVEFARDVQPILERHCWKCHGEDKQQGGLRLDHRDGAFGAGDTGAIAVTPGDIAASELVRRVEAEAAEERMPANAEPLSAEEIATLRAWVEQGADWPETSATPAPAKSEMRVTDADRQHWAYRPLGAVAVPDVPGADWARTPIDRFILEKLSAANIAPNPLADRRTLIRRAYYDLIGLPPTPEEVAAFVSDPDETAYEKLVDRLLESPHYGERWGRHWLDVARYADSDGMEGDRDRPNAYPYRDFVIRAFNDDLSYQTFVRWQLAGDEYEPDNPEALAATGFLTGAPIEPLMVPMEEERLRLRFNELDDMAATTSAAFLGLTLACARCHDHKFDAIPTRDYYRLQCALTTTARADVPLAPREVVEQYRRQEQAWNERREHAEAQLKAWFAEQRAAFEQALAAKKQETGEGNVTDDAIRAAFNDVQREQEAALRGALDEVESARPEALPTALAIVDKSAEPAPTWLLERGDFYAKKEELKLGFLTVLVGERPAEDYLAAARREMPTSTSTGQRRALAEWMTDADQGAGALLARVMVNRVWQHHFGEGLVLSVSDFGVRAEPPSHPELLEWLSARFVENGWRLKPLHREIMTSAAYMQSAAFDERRAEVDSGNRLLWRKRPMRLEAEILRDAVLQVSGELNAEQFGPAVKAPIPEEAMLARNAKDPYPRDAQDTSATRRRSVYLFHKRVVQHPFLQAFDAPDSTVSCGRRSITTVAPQSLALMNDRFVRDRAADFARRLQSETPDLAAQIKRGFELAVGRSPSDSEVDASREFVETRSASRAGRGDTSREEAELRALTDFCQTLFSLNEFIYVD